MYKILWAVLISLNISVGINAKELTFGDDVVVPIKASEEITWKVV